LGPETINTIDFVVLWTYPALSTIHNSLPMGFDFKLSEKKHDVAAEKRGKGDSMRRGGSGCFCVKKL